MATQKNANEKTEIGPANGMISIEVQRRWEGLLYGPLRGGAKPLWEGSLRRGDTPPSPLFLEGSNGEDGKARDPAYKRWDRFRLRLSAVSLLNKDGGLCGTVWAS